MNMETHFLFPKKESPYSSLKPRGAWEGEKALFNGTHW